MDSLLTLRRRGVLQNVLPHFLKNGQFLNLYRKSWHRMSVARSQSVEVEKSRKLSMMNTSVGEKLIEEEIAEEGSVSMRMIISLAVLMIVCE